MILFKVSLNAGIIGTCGLTFIVTGPSFSPRYPVLNEKIFLNKASLPEKEEVGPPILLIKAWQCLIPLIVKNTSSHMSVCDF